MAPAVTSTKRSGLPSPSTEDPAASGPKTRPGGAEAGAALFSEMTPQHREAVRFLYRDFCQQVRFGSSVAMNRGKCEGFLRDYDLQPSAKQTDQLMLLLLEDVHSAESVFNSAKSPSSGARANSPAKRKGIFSTSAPCSLPAFVDALRWLAVRRKAPLAQGNEADALPGGRAVGQLLDSTVLPKLERKVEPRLWKALRRARSATDADPMFRLLLSTNRAALDKLFAAYQLQGSKSRTDTEVSEDQFNTLLARLGVQGPWLSKNDINQALWLVKTWSSDSDDKSHQARTTPARNGADAVSGLEFRRCLALAVALNFAEDGGDSLCTGFRALLKQLEHSAVGQQLGFHAVEPKEAQLAIATASVTAGAAGQPTAAFQTKKKQPQASDDPQPQPSPSRQSRPNPFVSLLCLPCIFRETSLFVIGRTCNLLSMRIHQLSCSCCGIAWASCSRPVARRISRQRISTAHRNKLRRQESFRLSRVPSHVAQVRPAAEMTTRPGRPQPSPLASCGSQRTVASPTLLRPPPHRRKRMRLTSRRSVQRCIQFGNVSVRRCVRRRLNLRRACAR